MSDPEPNEIPSLSVGARKRADTEALAAELAALSEMDAPELRAEWRRLYRSHPPKLLRRDLLQLGVAWKLQERVLGGLSAATKRQLDELARTMATKSDLAKARKVSLKPGARLVRAWGGETHEVLVVEDGFQWRGNPPELRTEFESGPKTRKSVENQYVGGGDGGIRTLDTLFKV